MESAVPGVTALGRKVTKFEGLEVFPKPAGVQRVVLITDEVTSNCPVTGQPDFYTVKVWYDAKEVCVESKTVKLYFQKYRDAGLFCEAFAAEIAKDFAAALKTKVTVTVIQKPRGGVSIEATAVATPA